MTIIKKYLSIKRSLFQETYDKKRQFFDRIVSLWVYYVTRPVSFYLTPFFIISKVSANFTTFLGFLIGLVSLGYSIFGNFIQSAIFYNFFLIFDSIDGNIARLTNPTKVGEYYDAVTGDIINFLFIPFIGLGLYLNNFDLIINNYSVRINIFSIALITSLIHLICVLISQRKKIIFNSNSGPVRIGNNKKVTIIEYLIRNSFGFAFNAPASIFLAIFSTIELLIYYNVFVMPLLLIFTIFRK